MPDEGMAANLLPMRVSEGDEGVGLIPMELAPRRLDLFPLHRVLGRDAGEFRRREVPVELLVESVWIERRAEIAPARRRGCAERHFARLAGGGQCRKSKHDGRDPGRQSPSRRGS